jgi:hypothetical protein
MNIFSAFKNWVPKKEGDDIKVLLHLFYMLF